MLNRDRCITESYMSPKATEPVARQQYRQHLIASLDKFDCHLLPSGLVQRKLHKPEGAAIQVSYLHQRFPL